MQTIGLKRGLDALVDRLIRLAEILPAFAVADDHIFDTELFQHVGGDFSSERAVGGPVDILRTELDVAALDRLGDRGDGRERRADDDIGLRRADVGNQSLQGFDQGLALGGGLVHLPVSGDNDFAIHTNTSLFSSFMRCDIKCQGEK